MRYGIVLAILLWRALESYVWSCLFASFSFPFTFHGLFVSCESVGAILSERFTFLDLNQN